MKNQFSIVFLFLVCTVSMIAFVACNNIENDNNTKTDKGNKVYNEESNVWQGRSVKNTEIALEETKPVPKMDALENFGRYLEKIITEGRKTELDSHIISTRLNMEEAALLAEKSPLLEHIRYYAEDQLTIVTGGICILTADINGDGIDDVIEYGPDENGYSANMLNIYLGTEDGGVVLSYSQLLFDTWAAWTDPIEVVRYEEETYLLFMGSIDHNLRSLGINAYRISDGVPRDKLKLDYICSGVNVVITDNKDAYDTRFIEENSISLYHRAYPFHCDISCERVDYGSGETKGENSDELYDKYVEKYTAEQKLYVEKYAEKIYWYNISNISDSYESDINNDGITEKYVKEVKPLWLPELGFPKIGYSAGLPFMTGEYYGIHEGRYGLMYYIESEGEETDFFKMCGLDIWERELTPQYFWVEQTEKGNITYITFQDENEHKQYIEGYFIQGDSYERVISAEYIPSIECSINYEVIEESDNVGYIVHLSKDRKSLEFEWNDSNGQDKGLNQTIRKLIEKEIEATDFEGGEFEAVQYYPKEATKEKLIVDYMIFYYVPWADTMIEEHSDSFRISIDLLTGECVQIDED